jgi:hypothetical protein
MSKGGRTMKKILKGVLILFVVAIALAFMPVQQTMAADATFTYDKSPNFTFTIPSWDTSPNSKDPNGVLRLTADPLEVTTLSGGVADLSAGKTVKDLPKDNIAFLRKNYEATGFQTLYERDIKLSDGTPAYEFEIKWNHPAILLYTYYVVVIKDKKVVTISVTSSDPISADLKKYPLSLKFK